jgi:hypothetical protein
MIFIILQGSRAWVSLSLPSSMESLWIPEKTFGICEFPSHTSMAWLQDLQLIFFFFFFSSSCECTHKLFNSILPPSPLQTQGHVDHMPHMSVFPALTKEPLHMQIHTRVSVVWTCAWWHHNELLHHTAHFILTSRYTGFKAFHTK